MVPVAHRGRTGRRRFAWGRELLRFELHPDGDDTVLVFTQILSPQSTAARNGSGRHMCLAGLDALLDDGRPEHDGWQEVYDTYLALMGPALGTPGDAGTMTWERATHVDADRVREVTTLCSRRGGMHLLVQLGMYLAAGQPIPVEPKRWLGTYAELLRTRNC